ncbi:hypothetical protein MKQ68_08195 [Chitinophaga horti]|uniref:Lipoprotein n=1 Tax=Chitinophaga horti TaxID=2920382 RepID=A0ABY6J5W2_9BACT|nr:hypothetical protein [Chitinophaga horti]UYQ95074.1 hypothetical protein MKQ68_08195 [Chitinophaga horti]
MRSTLCKTGLALFCSTLLLAACNNNRTNTENDSIQPFNDSTGVFDTANLRHDTSAASDTSPAKRPNAGGQDTVRFSEHD